MRMMKTMSLLVIINAIILVGCVFLSSSDDARDLAEQLLNNR
jgi:hypothetical protein